MKISRCGQAEIFSDDQRIRIRKSYSNSMHRLIFDIACFTGERWGAILQLRVTDCYHNIRNHEVRDTILFRGSTRKRSAGRAGVTREVPLHSTLREILRAHSPPNGNLLFPSPRDHEKPISFQSADRAFRNALDRCGLSERGFSTHSTRRTFITRLSERGTDVRTIQAITGHRSMGSVQRYIEVNKDRISSAIENL